MDEQTTSNRSGGAHHDFVRLQRHAHRDGRHRQPADSRESLWLVGVVGALTLVVAAVLALVVR